MQLERSAGNVRQLPDQLGPADGGAKVMTCQMNSKDNLGFGFEIKRMGASSSQSLGISTGRAPIRSTTKKAQNAALTGSLTLAAADKAGLPQ